MSRRSPAVGDFRSRLAHIDPDDEMVQKANLEHTVDRGGIDAGRITDERPRQAPQAAADFTNPCWATLRTIVPAG
jgi:hypothetical protein